MSDYSKEGLISNNIYKRSLNFGKRTYFETIPELKSEINFFGDNNNEKLNDMEYIDNQNKPKIRTKHYLNDNSYTNTDKIGSHSSFGINVLQENDSKLTKINPNNKNSIKKNSFRIGPVRYSTQEKYFKLINAQISLDFNQDIKKMLKKNFIIIGHKYTKTLTNTCKIDLNDNILVSDKKQSSRLIFIQSKIKNGTNLFGNINKKYHLELNKFKNDEYFQNPNKFLTKIKISHVFLAIFSLLSILLEYFDNHIYISRSWKYLTSNKNFDKRNINDYYIITKRKISQKENVIRFFNIIFSVFCLGLILLIHLLKYQFIKKEKTRNAKRNKYNNIYDENGQHIEKKTLFTGNSNYDNIGFSVEEYVIPQNMASNENIIHLIFKCLINLIFLPPGVNKVFIGKYYNMIYVYSLNNIFLILTFLKISNIYRAILYLIPMNNIFHKLKRQSNLINFHLNFKFILKCLFKRYPISCVVVNIIIFIFAFSSVIYSVEYFSTSSKYVDFGYYENNSFKQFTNCVDICLFFGLKQMFYYFGKITFFGIVILLISGSFSKFLTTYFFYYLHSLIEI